MNSKFITPIILASAFSLSALSFVACGEDANNTIIQPGQSTGGSSSSMVQLSSETETTAIIFTGMGINSANLSKVRFDGTISLDISDSNAVADIDAVHITGVDFQIVKAGTMIPEGTVTVTTVPDFEGENLSSVSLSEMGVYTDLDVGYTECGDFELIITASAHDGVIPSVSIERIRFTRDAEKCREPESSSSAPPDVAGAPLDSVRITIDTKVNKCINAATGTLSDTETGDICFKGNPSGTVDLYSTTGVKFALYSNRSDSDRANDYFRKYLPKDPTTDDFLYLSSALAETYPNFIVEDDRFFVGIADTYQPYSGSAVGFYAFIVFEKNLPDANGDVTLTLLLYKAK